MDKLNKLLKEIEFKSQVLYSVCERDDVCEILIDDINDDLMKVLTKVINYKNKCKRG